MPEFGALSVWVETPTGVPLDAVDPVIVTEIPVAETWFAVNPPFVKVDVVAPTAITPAGFEMLSEEDPLLELLFVSPA